MARSRDQRGAALFEAAVVTPLLLLLVFGIIEFGMMYKDSLTLANGSRSGARVGSSAGSDHYADWQILQSVEGATGSIAHVDKVVVFKATGPDSTVPAGCKTGGVAGTCNYYTTADLSLTQAQFDISSGPLSWPASSRVTSISAPSGPDYIGIWVSGTHDSILGMTPDMTLTDTVVMRLEPTR